MSQINLPNEPCFAAMLGMDWGDKKHAWSLQPAESDQRERGEIAHTPEAVESWVSMLSTRFHGQPIAVESASRSGVRIAWKDASNTLPTIDSACGSPRRLPNGHSACSRAGLFGPGRF
jgi:hypothetical protein